MKSYPELVAKVIEQGTRLPNRTGVDTISLPGQSLEFDLSEGFPAVTTKRLAFKSVAAELCAFLRGYTNAKQFRDLGTKVWDQNANENQAWLNNPFRIGDDDLGPVYGSQWRKWAAYRKIKNTADARYFAQSMKCQKDRFYYIGNDPVGNHILRKEIDQLGDCVTQIIENPASRRILFHAWNPADLDMMALPPCHLLYQFHPNVEKNELSMCVYIRSNDLGLGAPFNIAESALLLSFIARITNYSPKRLTIFIGDAHVYVNHLDMIEEQMKREPYPLPKLKIDNRVIRYDPDFQGADAAQLSVRWLDMVEPDDFTLENYQHHPAISAPMAV